jgi:hypothetical protein
MTEESTPFPPPCAVCGKPCDLESCKADWNGQAVHEECLVHKLAATTFPILPDLPRGVRGPF